MLSQSQVKSGNLSLGHFYFRLSQVNSCKFILGQFRTGLVKLGQVGSA
jgi:hypothetical protein